jgi:hypothetical protein
MEMTWPEICRIYDGTYVYANAIHRTIAENCPEAFGKSPEQPTQLTDCLNGLRMLKYLKVGCKSAF